MIHHIVTKDADLLEEIVFELLERRIEFVYSQPDCLDNSIFPTETLIMGANDIRRKIPGLNLGANFYVKSDDDEFIIWLKLRF